MWVNLPSSSIEWNNENFIDLLSNKHIFEAISKTFFKREKKSNIDTFFEDESERKIFLSENIQLILHNLNKKDKFDLFIECLEWIYKENNDILWKAIIEKLKNKKFVYLEKWTPITARYTTINCENVTWVSWKLLKLADKYNIDILSLLEKLEVGWIKRDKSYFSNLNFNTRTRVSWIIEPLSQVNNDMVISIAKA